MDLLTKLRHRAGYRGLFLALFGFYDLFVGIDVLLTGRVSAVFFGGVFLLATTSLAVGLALLTGVFVRKDIGHFCLAIAFKAFWALEFFWLSFSYPILAINGVLWTILGIIVFLVATWPEPVIVVRPIEHE
jgi:hypothetical protein